MNGPLSHIFLPAASRARNQRRRQSGPADSGAEAASVTSGGESRPGRKRRRFSLGESAAGFVYGTLLWLWFAQVVGNPLLLSRWSELAPLAGLFCAVLITAPRARPALLAAGLAVCLLTALVGWTPLVGMAARGMVDADSLRTADAVVILSADIQKSGEPTDIAFQRIIHGLEVASQGFAPRLVVTRLAMRSRSYLPAVRKQMHRLGQEFPILETTPVWNTHDEALAVARLVRDEGWDRVILVTSPVHSRRAAATFRKVGIPVLSSPCIEHLYDLNQLDSMDERITAFQAWLHEAIGYQEYRRRGWL